MNNKPKYNLVKSKIFRRLVKFVNLLIAIAAIVKVVNTIISIFFHG
jgi:hypothetical protein